MQAKRFFRRRDSGWAPSHLLKNLALRAAALLSSVLLLELHLMALTLPAIPC